jgi:hypothetical protein
MWKFHRNMWDNVDTKMWIWVNISTVYHASISHTFATPLTHNLPMSCYRFVTYNPLYESSKAWQQWGKSMEKMWKTTPNVVVSSPVPSSCSSLHTAWSIELQQRMTGHCIAAGGNPCFMSFSFSFQTSKGCSWVHLKQFLRSNVRSREDRWLSGMLAFYWG